MSNPQPVQLATPHPSIRPPWQQRATPPEASSSLAARRFSSDASACEQHADCRSHRQSHGGATADAIHPVVEISPPDLVSRRVFTWHGMTAETVKTANQVNVEYCFRAPMHLLVAYEEGERRSGETFVEGAPRSSLRNFARKLTFVPAGPNIASGTSRLPAAAARTSTSIPRTSIRRWASRTYRLPRGCSSRMQRYGTRPSS